MRIVIITGLSGSGKSTAVRALEDEGFFCIDNLPIALIPTFVELVDKSTYDVREAALVTDIRGRDFLKGYEGVFRQVHDAGHAVEILFFDSTDEVLIRRFSETRRRHPAQEPGGSVPDGIHRERELLEGLRRIATEIIDTSELNVHQLRELVIARLRGEERQGGMTVHLQSFGYRYGIPLESDLLMDVRFLPNPHFVPDLKPFSGLDPRVHDFVMEKPTTGAFLARFEELLDLLLPAYRREGKAYLTVSIGCTGGRHRSVVIVEELRQFLAVGNYTVKVTHRDLEKG